mmetsp:Transcript_489/g.1649  ORF Transcript_489/g.1649 Transcript_489/m.1649 type:complete len:234 (+) Transcript_489:73-774(+)
MSRSRHPEITKATEGTNKNSPREPRGVSPASRLGQAPGSTPRHARLPAAFAKLRRAVPVPRRLLRRPVAANGAVPRHAAPLCARRLATRRLDRARPLLRPRSSGHRWRRLSRLPSRTASRTTAHPRVGGSVGLADSQRRGSSVSGGCTPAPAPAAAAAADRAAAAACEGCGVGVWCGDLSRRSVSTHEGATHEERRLPRTKSKMNGPTAGSCVTSTPPSGSRPASKEGGCRKV